MLKLKNYIRTSLQELSEDYPDKQIGKALKELSRVYLMRSELSELKITDSLGLEIDDIRGLVEGNSHSEDKRAILAVIQSLEGYYRVAYHYGDNPNMLIVSGTMDIAIVIDNVSRILKSFKRENIDPFSIDFLLPKGTGLTQRFRTELIKTFAK